MKTKLIVLISLLAIGCLAHAQQRVTGTVKWDDDRPVVGASVTVKGSTVSTVTDADGEYEIQAKPTDALEIIVPYHKKWYTYHASRLSVWADLGLAIPESYTGSTNYSARYGYLFGYDKLSGACSYPSGGIGIGYQFINNYFLVSIGLELLSMNDYYCYEYLTGSYTDVVDKYGDTRRVYEHEYHKRTENHIYAQMPFMMGFEVPYFYMLAGMKIGTSLYDGSMADGTKSDWTCMHWGPTVELGVNIDKGPSITRLQLDQKGKADYSGRTYNYKIALVYDFGANHNLYKDEKNRTHVGWLNSNMFLGLKFTASIQSDIHRKEHIR